MQLGLFMQPVHDPVRDYTEVLEQDREAVILADQLGYSECWIGEHVSATTEPITSPLIFLASLLQETSQIKLGTGVFCLAIKHPALVAAEAALFDHLAKGRFLMGIGPGGLSSDLELFGVAGDDVDRGAMVQQSIDTILGIWAGEPPYRIEGDYWKIQIENLVAIIEGLVDFHQGEWSRSDVGVSVFGDEQVTKERVAKAISQFERTLASFDSPYDRFVYGGDQEALNEAELRGMFLFIHTPGVCEKCHPPPLFTNNEFMNNGLETDPKDPGRAKISEDPADRGKHKTPTLRNIAQSGPYMHDGRFETLRQVVEHYNTGVEEDAPNLAPELGPAALDSMGFTEDNLDDLVAFLGALSEDAFLNDPKLGDPDDE